MTGTEFINKFFLQFLFVRLTKWMTKDRKGNYTIVSRWGFMYWVKPLTGWKSDFKYLGGKQRTIWLPKLK